MMNELTFQQPAAVWLLPAAAAIALAAGHLLRRVRFAAIATHALLASSTSAASRIRRLPAAIGLAALGPIVLALMDPVLPYGEERVESRGVDIAIVLDLSSSMEERMATTAGDPLAQRTRLDVTKRVISDFVARRPDDRIGLVVFSDNAYVVSPLTVDHRYLQRYIAMIDEQTLRNEGMTAVGEGLASANMLLARQDAPDSRRERVIVLLTDGENNYGRSPILALREAHDAANRVHMIGVDLDDEIKHKPEVMRLIRAVQRQGGQYYTADTAAELAGASRAIDSLERGVLVSSRTIRNAPAFDSFAAAAILLICAALAVRCVPFFVDLT
jgi:Ca-activated chloride channel family protein